MQSILYLFEHFTTEFFIIEVALLLAVLTGFIGIWLYNRKKYQQLAHQIPAGVVKSYLDSIIQNSSALKSSLFRGGGVDLGQGAEIPSVLPLSNLGGSGAAEASGVSQEELNQKNAEIASLKSTVDEKQKVIAELEAKLSQAEAAGGSGEDTAPLKAKISELEEELKKAQENLASAASGDGGEALAAITKERDDLKDKLAEYEIIEDDLANLKKLQQENEQLRKSLEEAGGSAPAEAAPEPAPEASAPEPAPEAAAPEPAPEAVELAPEAAAAIDEANAEAAADSGVPENAEEGEEKSAEDLLNEFEKMLG